MAHLDSAAQALAQPITRLDWDDVWFGVDALVARLAGPTRSVHAVYGVPTGGALVAALVADRMKIACLTRLDLLPKEQVLIVDDLVDSGRTLQGYVDRGYQVEALFRKPVSPSHLAPDAILKPGWLMFPWEHEGAPTDAVVRLLQFIGEDPLRDGLRETPRRVTKALREMTAGYAQDYRVILSTTFDIATDELVLVKDVRFSSLCEHHLLPFVGRAWVGYVPNEKVVGLSKLARLVECFAKRLQVQERLTVQIAEAIMVELDPKGAAVVIEAAHECMGCRGVKQPDARMVTSSMLGLFRDNQAARLEFLSLCKS